jgi:transglutaminase-like putative cysteine protease
LATATARQSIAATPQGFGPAEGWSVVLPHLAALALTAYSITKIGSSERAGVLIPMILAGMLFGLVMAKLPVLDSLAHLAALFTGTIAALAASAVREVGLHALLTGRGRPIYNLGRDMADRLARGSSARLPDVEILALIALTLWLVGYSSAWMLYRHEWLIPSLVLPGTMLMVTMRYDEQPPAFPVVAFLFCAILMSARHHAYREARDWGRRRLAAPSGVSAKLATGGAVIAALALLAGWGTTYQASETLRSTVSDQSAQVWEKLQEAWTKTGLPGSGTMSSGGTYSSFPSSFDIGGNLNLSDQVVANVDSATGHYLTVRSYDYYTGSGWETTIDDTFKMPGDKNSAHAIPIAFGPRQSVPFSASVAPNLAESEAAVHVLQSKDGLVFTIESFDSSSLQTVALMGWIKLDHLPIDVAHVDVSSLPPDLQGLVRYLQQADIRPGPNGGEPIIVQNGINSSVAAERERLKGFPLQTQLALDDSGDLILTVTGRLPNYDDIESVYQSLASNGNETYRVAGVQSAATPSQLANAGTNYPGWVTSRYLQQSSTVTSRTKALAHEIVEKAGANNPFDEAWAIQKYLTGPGFTYQLNSPGPKNGQDFVDYFLFDSKVGRCEQYATSMVVLLRELGIPSRLVSGYRVGEQNELGEWVYRENQAHTWVEVYFPGQGWIPFEPTKGQQPFDYGQTRTSAEVGTPTPEPTEAAVNDVSTPVPTATPSPTATPAPVAATTGSNNSGHWWNHLSGTTVALLVAVAALGALAGATCLAWAWRFRGLTTAGSLYARVLRVGSFVGVESDPTMTPSEFAEEFRSAIPAAGPAVRLVTDLYTAERYGGATVEEQDASRARNAWRQMRRRVLIWRTQRKRR